MTIQADDNSWMLELIRTVRGVRHVVVLTSDGLLRVRTDNTDNDVAQKLAAACAGLSSLGKGMSMEFGSGSDPRQVMVEFDGGYLFIRGAGDGSRLAVVTESVIDPGLIAQQMQAQVQMIGERALSTPSRTD
ncbi:putative regulator of Ras-like GTPase activity (Roadblock/LC7/MglB family) [Saccharopolyspora lacisalsi]|uniref:Putative regulator of Ras-like GTPase activity (Roadblock/LC7/MglB family) n=1 Tax=Halosaccharopolyspora lacisalsi TaxID=1000566 RepID=A0A839E6F7_9PSEU|nr:roadblock/LC7 domain-containing protein [Halosaccharopolyspora lacisalsi]MBA8827465.1 putative regulator of Ras-like GTPase activity (Roadblock/LC7/MglB family) [Halosaccharopolyspora lacisalsi]